MTERSLSGVCKKFSANVFHENKCQNCFKPKDVHQEAPSPATRPTTLEVTTAATNRNRTTIKTGYISRATQISTLPDISVQKWERFAFVLYSSGDLEWFATNTTPGKPGQIPLGCINLDDCIGLTSAEVDTNEPFSIGIKTPLKSHYLKAENRLEMDNWCRVLKPFVIASAGYFNNEKKTATRSMSTQDIKTNSSSNAGKLPKSPALRTVSAPWQSNVNEESLDGGRRRRPQKPETDPVMETNETTYCRTAPQPQPYFIEKYLSPETTEEKKINGEVQDEKQEETRDERWDKGPDEKVGPKQDQKQDVLEIQLTEARRQAKHNEGKAEICSKNLSETKKCLHKANNMISIQKANIESLKSEMEMLQVQLKNVNTEKQVKELENGLSLSSAATLVPGSVEAGFLKLQAKLQENEEALIRRTRELEKANASRAKVAKHTRSLLLELESKLNVNNRRIAELEEQLLNRTLDLQYEKEERERIEKEKGKLIQKMGTSKEHLKQREITMKRTELLEQAKHDHLLLKNTQKSHARHQEEVQSLRSELQDKSIEVERLRKRLEKIDEKRLEDTLKKSQEECERSEKHLKLITEKFTKQESKCLKLETSLKDLTDAGKEKEKELVEMRSEKDSLENELENDRKLHDEQMLLLQEDNEKTRDKLQEVQQQLTSLRNEKDIVDGGKVADLEEHLKEWKAKFRESRKENEKLQKIQEETLESFNNEKNKRLMLERDFSSMEKENKGRKSLEEEVLVTKEKLASAEKTIKEERDRVKEIENLLMETEQMKNENDRTEKMITLENKLESSEIELRELEQKLYEREEKVLFLAEELESRLKVEEEAFGWVEGVERNLLETEKSLIASKESILLKSAQLDKEKVNIVDAVKLLGSYVESLEGSVKQEKSKVVALEEQLACGRKTCNACDEKELEKLCLRQKLDKSYEELEKFKASSVTEAQGLKSLSEEIKLKLTSKVILLQSDISELKAKNEHNISEHNKELTALKQTYEELVARSNETGCLTDRIKELESELEDERTEHERKFNSLKADYEASKTETTQNGVVSPDLLEQLQEKHAEEIKEIEERHRRELEGNKSDMMMVLQALKSDSYQSNTMSNESIEANDQLNKHDRYVETLKKDHEKEIDQLKEEHEQDLQQLRSDMVTLLRVQETYKAPGSGDEQPVSDNYSLYDLNRQLEAMKQHYEREAQEKDDQHRLEVEQLKGDMLVAIQAASIAGGTPQGDLSPNTESELSLIKELQDKITKMEEEFEKERDVFQNTIKKAESATKFGLRRNEEMSNKIYQMQREMEEIDTKYQKEIKMYKEAFDEGKARIPSSDEKTEAQSENESLLKVKLQELELDMEQMQVRYDGEIKRYKEKFQQENVLTVEELQLKIKSLEDSIEQMRLEHANELDRYTKAVKRGKVSLTGTAKERDLERKIDDLESKVDVMRQKHREEVRKYRERLEDEMERHRKEVTESRAKLRKLESDNRHCEELKNKITELENKNCKLSKETSRFKEMEGEVTELRSKNRELTRNADALKRKLDKLEEAKEESEGISRNKLQRYTSCDNVTVATGGRTKGQLSEIGAQKSVDEDTFEINNNKSKNEIGGYRLNPGLKRPASISSLPTQSDTTSPMRRSYSEKRREGSANRPYAAAYAKSSSSTKSK